MENPSLLLIPSDDFGWTDLRRAIYSILDMHVVSEAASINIATEVVKAMKPDIILSAATVGEQSTLPFLTNLQRDPYRQSRIVVFSNHFATEEIVALADIGIMSCMLWKDLNCNTINHLIKLIILEDICVLSRSIAKALADFRHKTSSFPKIDRFAKSTEKKLLTAQQTSILQAVAAGYSTREIATQFYLSPETIRTHLRDISRRLAVHSRIAAIQRARECGYLS